MKKVTLGLKLLGAACLVSSVSILFSACGGGIATTDQEVPSVVVTNTKPAGSTATAVTTTAPTTAKPTVNTNISVSAVPSLQTAKPGDTFDVTIKIKNDKPARGVQFALSWDPAKVSCVSTDLGSYFKDFALANKGSIFALPSEKPAFDNTTGRFPKGNEALANMAIALTGAQGPNGTFLGVTGAGDVYTLHMIVNSGASGTTEFKLSQVVLGDNSYETNDMDATVVNGKIDILP